MLHPEDMHMFARCDAAQFSKRREHAHDSGLSVVSELDTSVRGPMPPRPGATRLRTERGGMPTCLEGARR
jgi:hypothetical protein